MHPDKDTADYRLGQRVRVLQVPPNLPGEEEMQTHRLFKGCVGKVFVISDVNRGLLGLDVGEVNGIPAYMETIYIEPEFVEAESGGAD